jgi:hypothetical protein
MAPARRLPARRWRPSRTSRQNRRVTSDASDDKARSVAPRVADYRGKEADAFETLTREQWESASWCSCWRVRDVLGHLVHNAEASRVSMVREVIRHPIRPDRGLDRLARQLGKEPVPALTQRLREAQHGGVHVIGFPAAVGLGDVHGNDALRALGLEFGVDPDDAVAVLNASRRGSDIPRAAPWEGQVGCNRRLVVIRKRSRGDAPSNRPCHAHGQPAADRRKTFRSGRVGGGRITGLAVVPGLCPYGCAGRSMVGSYVLWPAGRDESHFNNWRTAER